MSTRSRPLTRRQTDALVILSGRPRTAGELADHLGAFAAPSAARSLAAALERKGYAERITGTPLAWRITEHGRRALALELRT
jgi:DNA-binding MarR family transcriptional regulator